MSLHVAAQHLARQGRGEDRHLVHMTPNEVAGLQALAKAHGTSLTINPSTGLPEAGVLSAILPTLIGAGLTVASGGALSPLMAAGITGAGYAAATGNIQKGLMAGLGAYGGGSLGAGLADMGAGAIAGEAAAPQMAALQAVTSPEMYAEGMSAAAMGLPEQVTAAQTAYGNAANAAKAAALKDGYGMNALGRGVSELTSKGGLEHLASRLGGNMGALQAAGMAAAPLMADMMVPSVPTATKAPAGTIRPMQFTRRQTGGQPGSTVTGERQHFDDRLTQLKPYDAAQYAGGGTVGFAAGGVPEGWAVNGDNWYHGGDVFSAAQAQDMIAAAAPPPVLTPPDGWGVTPGGDKYYRIDPVAGGDNVLTPSQAAYTWGAPNPERYLPTPTPVAPPTPTFAMADDGSIGPVTDPKYQFSVDQARAGAEMLNQQLLGSGANPYLPPPTVTDSLGRTSTYTGPSNVPRRATPAPSPAPSGAPAPIAPVPVGTPEPVNPGDGFGFNPIPPAQPAPSGAPAPSSPPAAAAPPAPGRPLSPVMPPSTPAPAVSPPGGPVWGPLRDTSVSQAMPWGSAARDYFMRNEDVATGFRTNNFGMSADDFARQHFEKFGRGEGRYFRGLSQPVRTDANPFNTTKGASRDALAYLAGERMTPGAPVAPAPAPDLSGIQQLLNKTKADVEPDAFAQSYMNRYPDVYLAYKENPLGMDINEFARRHYQQFGAAEKRDWLDPNANNGSNDPVGGGWAAGGAVPRGGLSALAGGHGRLLRGPGDGVSDSIPATIEGRQPAALADGEFVIPARAVSELGNGSTEAGARQLYAMLERIQQRRAKTTGRGQIARDSKASKVLPA